MLRLLVRSATGAELTQYTTFHCGPKRPGDADGPEEMHIVLVDNGRTRMLAEGLREMLRCIRCGACMNHCVVFRQIGGHAYGGTYPGPMGAVLTPAFVGLAKARELAHACTMNGRCQEVCPVDDPAAGPAARLARPQLARGSGASHGPLRHRPVGVRRPAAGLYRLASAFGRARDAAVRAARLDQPLPLAGGWTAQRDFPPSGKTFMELHRTARGSGERLVTQRASGFWAVRAGLGGPPPPPAASPPRRRRCWRTRS